jgi:dienelactone hydrolase
MNRSNTKPSLILCLGAVLFGSTVVFSAEIEPFERGPYSVGSTNMQVAPDFVGIGDEAMHNILLGLAKQADQSLYVSDILKHPESAWIIDVPVPEQRAVYGPASGQSLSVTTFLTYPASAKKQKNSYAFPYHNAKYGVFEDMLGAGQAPNFADSKQRYPLIILAHGSSAHGIYDVAHAHSLASHGYIVAVIFYGDDRTVDRHSQNHHLAFLRPLLTKAVLESLLESEAFGAHIDADNIGISGHSFGGFTALAIAGGSHQGNPATVSDERIKAGVIAAPWVGDNRAGYDFFAFGPDNKGLNQVTVPMLAFFSTKDESTLASFILPAMKQLSGPSYVVELVDQPHVFEEGSWQDRDNWELLFFAAYLKHDAQALATLKTGRSMQGGNQDIQLFDYQRTAVKSQ